MGMLKEIPGRVGVFEVDGLPGFEIELAKWRAGGLKDTVQPATTTLNKKVSFFQSPANKNGQHKSFETPGKIPSHTELIINRVGLQPAQAFGNTIVKDTDILKICYASFLTVKFDKERVVAEGAGYEFPYGKGVTGQTTRSSSGIVTNGVAARGATEELLVAQPVDSDDTILAELDFPDNSWFVAYTDGGGAAVAAGTNAAVLYDLVPITLHLDGLEKRSR